MPKKKKGANGTSTSDESEKNDLKGDTPDELVYRDSSTFLKVNSVG